MLVGTTIYFNPHGLSKTRYLQRYFFLLIWTILTKKVNRETPVAILEEKTKALNHLLIHFGPHGLRSQHFTTSLHEYERIRQHPSRQMLAAPQKTQFQKSCQFDIIVEVQGRNAS